MLCMEKTRGGLRIASHLVGAGLAQAFSLGAAGHRALKDAPGVWRGAGLGWHWSSGTARRPAEADRAQGGQVQDCVGTC